MANPLIEQREREAVFSEIGIDILRGARNELYLNMRFLDVALSSLAFVPEQEITVTGTDARALYFHPGQLASLFRKSRILVNRAYLHSILHCLFGHLWGREGRDVKYWDLACDITAEWVVDGLEIRAVHIPKSAFRRSVYREFSGYGVSQTPARDSTDTRGTAPGACFDPGKAAAGGSGGPEHGQKEKKFVPTAQRIYRILCQEHFPQPYFDRLAAEFTVDDHRLWQQENDPDKPQPLRSKWEDIRDRMQTETEIFSKEASGDAKSLTDQIQIEGRTRYDYREFLRKFAVLKEEMQVDADSFDYIFYNYGMSLYGNMPLIEPLETKEVKKIEDFVIVVDTSMSCRGDLIRHFLEETCGILWESESFFRRINVHIIQCDDQVQEDAVITSRKDLEDYIRNFTVKGLGGTDFRPAFMYVEELLRRQAFTKLRGLLYFTDGCGTFPLRRPRYETAFIFMKEDYRDEDVPPWAIKLVLAPEDLEDLQ